MRRAVIVSVAVVAFLIGVAFGSVFLSSTGTTTITQTLASNSSTRLHEVIFNQDGICSPPVYLAPWSVTLANTTTIAGPPNATLPLSETSFSAAPRFKAYAVIMFLVPDGTYVYTIEPQFLAQTGTVKVIGADLMIQVHSAPVSCSTTRKA